MAPKFKAYYLLAFLFLFLTEIKAQVCVGALGLPIASAGTNFGSGANPFGNSLPTTVTNYNYIAGTPNDGFYTITKSTLNLNPGWHQDITNHTPDDPNGYMMVVNASNTPGIFFQTNISGLCPGTTYEFASYVINILRNPGIKPNIKFTIENDGVVIQEFSTGDILEGTSFDWKKYGTIFKTPTNVGIITLKMTNVNPGGTGNDLAIDDITFRPCGPEIKPKILSTSSNIAAICQGKNANIELSAEVSAAYNNPRYQWQVNTGTGWINLNVPGAQTTDATVSFTNAIIGTYNYQLLVADGNNINSENCRIVSSPLTVNVIANPIPIASFSGIACVGNNLTLSVNGNASDKYVWTGPNNFTANEQNPVLTNISLAQAGNYRVTVTNASNCSTLSNLVNIAILPPINAKVAQASLEICEQKSIQLVASGTPGGNYSYTWLPADGLSNANIANPIASPTATTTYTVTLSNGNCSETATVLVKVLKNAVAGAGEDKKILAGQSVELNGTATGDGTLTYTWSPSSYLDDPNKLNPIASPPIDITYTLTVSSDCNSSTDEVFIKSYPKIEIPNAFSPNGDGINDIWNIAAATAFPHPQLKIFNRNGQVLYESKGAFKPWDGKFKGTILPIAAYYYTLFLNEDFKPFSGWIFLTK